MQSNIIEPKDLPDLPPATFIDQWVLESPLLLMIVLVAMGAVAFIALRHTKHAKHIGLPSLGLGVLLGAGIYLAGHFVTTDREHLKQRSSQLVAAAAIGDEQQLKALLHEEVRVQTMFVSQSQQSRIIALAKSRAAPLIDSASVREVRAGLFGQQVARTQVKIRVKGDMIPPMSWWTLDWTRPSPDSDQWVVTHIEPIWIQGFSNPAGTTSP